MKFMRVPCIAIICATIMAEDKPVDPMAWTASGECPAFREVLKNEDYAARLKGAQPQLAKMEAERAKTPPRCLKVLSVNKDSQGERLNLEAGDFVLKLDDKEVSDALKFNSLRTNAPQKLTILSMKRGMLTVDIQPGMLGTRLGTFIRDDPAEVGEGYDDPRWHNDLKIASYLFVDGDSELIETAFYRAIKSGMKMTVRMKVLGAALAQKTGRYDDAMDFAWHAMKTAPDDQGACLTFCCAAACSYKLKAALEITRKTPLLERNIKELERLVAEHESQPAARRMRPAPSIACENYFFDDIILRSNSMFLNEKSTAGNENTLRNFLWNDGWKDSFPSGTFTVCRFKPAVRNLNFSLHFTVKQTTPEFSNWQKTLFVGAAPLNEKGEPRFENMNDAIGLQFTPAEMPSIRIRNIDLLSTCVNLDRPGLYEPGEVHHYFEMYIVDGQIEMFLDEKRIYYAPAGKISEKYALQIAVVGTTFTVWGVRAWELLTEAERKERVDKQINERYREKESRLFRAVSVGTLKYITQLLDLGADPNTPSELNVTPLHQAMVVKRKDVAELLLARGAKLDAYSAAGIGDAKQLAELLANQPSCPWSPLHIAAEAGQIEAARVLLEKGTDVNTPATDRFGKRTPLIWAAIGNQKGMLEFLLSRGASINLADAKGHTAMWYAQQHEAKEAIAFLKEKGAVQNQSSVPMKPPPPPTGDF
jgi:hypothetical protein